MSARTHRSRNVALAATTAAVLGVPLLSAGGAPAATTPAPAASPGTETTVPVFAVTQEGLKAEEGAALAEKFEVPNALRSNGAFAFTDARFAQVPLRTGRRGKDEAGRRTTVQALDTAALKRIKPLSDDHALQRAAELTEFAALGDDLKATPKVSHTQLSLADRRGRVRSKHNLDTAVSFSLELAGLPVGGQGGRLRIAFDGDGKVTQLSHSLRKLQRGQNVQVIDAAAAKAGCARLYGRGVSQRTPTLGYQFPELAANQASGEGRVQTLFPQYTCNPVTKRGTQAHRLLPAVPDSAPRVELTGSRRGEKVTGATEVAGGTGPYTYRWSSSTTALLGGRRDDATVSYTRKPRVKRGPARAAEQLTVEVTDVNGLSATATVALNRAGTAKAASVPGGGGFGVLAVGPVDVGIEQTVDEWQCAQDSAIGFKNEMAAHAVPTAFDWRGANAWERDFKDPTKGGGDQNYVDNVDAQWYTGHGSSGGFTFKSSVDDTQITPADARWGNRDLEWLQLESCQVLRDTSGTHDYFGRWGPTLDRLHMLNGFHTNAYCVGGGTGGTFADYLFPETLLWWTLRPAQTVRVAWASMALDREPAGVVYRSMGLIGPGWSTNIGDYFWGQGPTGPDISKAGATGYWSITGTV